MPKLTSKRSSAVLVALAGLGLNACGLTGPLEQPEPLIGTGEKPDLPPERLTEATPELDRQQNEPPRPLLNELGGELPAAAPVEKVEESGLPPLKDGN